MKFKLEEKVNEVALIFFILGAVMFLAGFYMYSKSDSAAYEKTVALINSCKSDYKTLEDRMNSNIATVGSFNQRINDLKDGLDIVAKGCTDMGHEIDSVRSKCADLRESQIKLRETLSNKRPVIKVDVIDNSLLKKAGVKK